MGTARNLFHKKLIQKNPFGNETDRQTVSIIDYILLLSTVPTAFPSGRKGSARPGFIDTVAGRRYNIRELLLSSHTIQEDRIMTNKYQWILKRATALLAALLMALSVLPLAAAASADWTELQISVSWYDSTGALQSAAAFPAGETETGEGCFWVLLPADAPLDGLTFTAFHPAHEYQYSPEPGSVLAGVTDAGEYMDGVSFVPISATDPGNGMTEVFYLYISTVTDQPLPVPDEQEPYTEPEPEPYVEPQPEPEPYVEPQPEPEPYVEPQPEPEPYVEPQPEPEPYVEPQPEPEPYVEQAAAQEPESQAEVPTEAPVMPVGEMINSYGMTAAKVNYRKEPSKDAGKYGELAANTMVYLIYTEVNSAGEMWTLVEADGHTGYLMSEFITVLTPEDSNAYSNALPNPAHIYTYEEIFSTTAAEPEPAAEPAPVTEPEPAAELQTEPEPYVEPQPEPEPYVEPQAEPEPNVEPQPEPEPYVEPQPEPEPVAEAAPANEPEPEAEPAPETNQETATVTEAPVIIDGEMINRYGITNAVRLALREQPDKKGKELARLDKGIHVYMYRAEQNSAGESWTYVEVNGRRGYIKTEFLNPLTQQDSDEWDSIQPTRAPVLTEAELFPQPEAVVPEQVPETAETDQTENNEPDNSETGIGTPESSEPEATTPENNTSETGNPENNTPENSVPENNIPESIVPENNETGIGTPESNNPETNNPEADQNTVSQPAAETPAPEIPVGEMMNRYGKTNSKVFFRKDPSTKSNKLSQLGKNTYVYMIHTKEYDNNEVWTYALVNGKPGYIMTEYLDALTEEDSAAWNQAQASPAPVYSREEFFPTEPPAVTDTPVPTDTPTTVPTDTPTQAPTDKPTQAPTETPTQAPTDTPTQAPTDTPTQAPTDTPVPAPTDTPVPVPTDTPVPAPTQEPPQLSGYGITIGEGIPVRQRPTAASAIKEELPVNKIVYVYGQIYQDGIAWHEIEHDGKWGYVRADLIRIMSYGEMAAYEERLQPQDTPIPNVTMAPYTYDPNELSCYGYVTTDAVNFRTEASSSSRRIRLMKKYATFIVYGAIQADGETWYKVSYEGQIGYLNGKYFKQMTVSEAEQFLQSDKYREGLANNNIQNTTDHTASSPTTTGSPSGIVTAEDQKVSEWVNPAAGAAVSYKPFDPFATPEPLPENEFENNQFVNSLIDQVKAGTLKKDELKIELEKFYKDAADPTGIVERAMTYIEGKTDLAAEEPTQSPEPLATEEINEFPQEQSTGGGAGWVIAGVLLAAGGGGGYYWYLQRERKRKAAQRMAQKRVAQQNKAAQQSKPRTAGQNVSGNSNGNAASAQNAARVRTGSYTGSAGTAKPRVTPTTPSSGTNNGKVYGNGTKNPYGRYTRSGSDEESAYTASFKPEGGETRPRRSRIDHSDQKPEA